ncbi:hypothetical protein VPHD520_0082 [Vibrio phage D520]
MGLCPILALLPKQSYPIRRNYYVYYYPCC